MIHIQDGISYRIEGGILKGWIGTSPFTKPLWNGTSIEEGWTQADQDALVEAEEMRTVGELLLQFETDGRSYFQEVATLVRFQKNKGTITQAQFDSIRDILSPAMQPLKDGEWDRAKVLVDAITPPSNPKMLTLLNLVKTKIDTYLSENA